MIFSRQAKGNYPAEQWKENRVQILTSKSDLFPVILWLGLGGIKSHRGILYLML